MVIWIVGGSEAILNNVMNTLSMFPCATGKEFDNEISLGLELLNHGAHTHSCFKQCQTTSRGFYINLQSLPQYDGFLSPHPGKLLHCQTAYYGESGEPINTFILVLMCVL